MVNLFGGFVNIQVIWQLLLMTTNSWWQTIQVRRTLLAVKSSIVGAFAAVLLVTSAIALSSSEHSPNSAVIGTWEGESKCTVPDSPCHDEHVIYTIMPAESGGGLTVQADKVVNGERQNMGTLPCRYDAAGKRLTCVTEGAKRSDWLFIVSGDSMTGTLTLRNEHQLYRRIRVERLTQAKKP